MAVYTDVAADELAEFLGAYEIGDLLSYKGIAEGVENSNFLLHTTAGYFILTLYEKRVARGDLPFFLGLMTHLASRGISCPPPLQNTSGEALSVLVGRPGRVIHFLGAMRRTAPASAGRWRKCIWPAPIFRWRAPMRCRCRAGVHCSKRRPHAPTKCSTGCAILSAPNSIISRATSGRRICRRA